MKKIVTQAVARNFAMSGWLLLEETPETRLYFKPEIHPGGVRGHLVRYRKDRKGDWKVMRNANFTRTAMAPMTMVEIDFSTVALSRLLSTVEEHSKIVEQGVKRGRKEYIVAESDKVVIVDDETKKGIFENLLKKGYTPEFWQLLQESEPELATRLSIGHLHAEKVAALQELKDRLTRKYSETTGLDSWQRWIYEHNWLFGINYVRTIEKAKINIGGSMPDYLFLTADHSVDILEIKLPEEEVIVEDASHPGAYKWSAKANEAIGQTVAYLGEIDRLQLELEREIDRVYALKVSLVKPRGFILIGKKDDWSKQKREALRKLNFALHGIEILTYTDLLQRGAEIAGMYKEQVENRNEDMDNIPF